MGDDVGLDVLLTAVFEEGVHILGIYHHAHTLLRFADGHFRAVKAFVFGSDGIQIDVQAVGQLANGHTHTASPEVVGLLDQAGDFPAAEEMLDLAFFRGVTLLYLSGTGVERLLIVFLGRACGPSDTVTTSAATEHDDHIARLRVLTMHMVHGRGPDHGTDFQSLGLIILVIDLAHMRGSQANLVAVG